MSVCSLVAFFQDPTSGSPIEWISPSNMGSMFYLFPRQTSTWPQSSRPRRLKETGIMLHPQILQSVGVRVPDSQRNPVVILSHDIGLKIGWVVVASPRLLLGFASGPLSCVVRACVWRRCVCRCFGSWFFFPIVGWQCHSPRLAGTDESAHTLMHFPRLWPVYMLTFALGAFQQQHISEKNRVNRSLPALTLSFLQKFFTKTARCPNPSDSRPARRSAVSATR